MLRADMFEAETDLHSFMRHIERRRQETAAWAGALAGNIAELDARQRRFERRERSLRDLMFKLLDAAGLRKLELPEATIGVMNGRPRVILDDNAVYILPDDMLRIRKEPDKGKIAELLKGGTAIQGASLSNAEPVLTIRTK